MGKTWVWYNWIQLMMLYALVNISNCMWHVLMLTLMKSDEFDHSLLKVETLNWGKLDYDAIKYNWLCSMLSYY